MRKLLLCLITGCNFAASSKVENEDTAFESTDEDTETADTEENTDEPDPDPLTIDDDEDGYTENQGDCDDASAEVFPGAEDVCDGISNDCDEEIDEDAFRECSALERVSFPQGVRTIGNGGSRTVDV